MKGVLSSAQVYNKVSHKEVELKEIGPRFEMRLFQVKKTMFIPRRPTECLISWSMRGGGAAVSDLLQAEPPGPAAPPPLMHESPLIFVRLQVKLGTLEQTEAQNEYVYRPYLSNSKTKNLL